MSDKPLKPKWQVRFDYFEATENMSKSERKEFDKQYSFFSVQRQKMNIFAFLFGPIYFFILGLWRKGLVLLLANILLSVLAVVVLQGIDTSDNVDGAILNVISFGFMFIFAYSANYAYYLHVRKGSKSWNPFEGWKNFF